MLAPHPQAVPIMLNTAKLSPCYSKPDWDFFFSGLWPIVFFPGHPQNILFQGHSVDLKVSLFVTSSITQPVKTAVKWLLEAGMELSKVSVSVTDFNS